MSKRITGHTELIGLMAYPIRHSNSPDIIQTGLVLWLPVKTMNGLGMMLFQGSASFELWTGKPMPIEYMKNILHISYDD